MPEVHRRCSRIIARRRCAVPLQAPLRIPQTLTEVTGPAGCWERLMGEAAADLTRQHAGTPLGQRIIVQGRVSG